MIKQNIVFTSIFAALVLLSTSVMLADAYPYLELVQTNENNHESQTETISLDGIIGLEKTVVFMHASKDNTLPWGFVEGKISNHVEGYPVIIQIYNDEGGAVHFAQTNVNENGTYEYKFRVKSFDGTQSINIFEGDYLVSIFKVVYLDDFTLV